MRRRHELYIAASTTAVDHFVKNVSQVLGLPRTDVELRLESLLRQLFPRLARSPETLAKLLNAPAPAPPAEPGRSPSSSPPAVAALPQRSRRVPPKPRRS